jgi:hypothetical protein
MLPQAGDLLAIQQEILSGARLDDRERIRQMVLEEKASLEAGLVRAGHRVVNTRVRAGFDEAGWTHELTGGISYLFYIRSLLEQIDRDWPAVSDTFEQIRRRLISQRSLVANVTLDNAGWQVFRPQLLDFLDALPDQAVQKETWQPGALPNVEGLAVPSQVNYVGKGGNLFKAGYQLDGSALAILNYLNATWLWEKVRVQGGAYGGFAVFDQHSGVFSYVSYRDPNLRETLAIYDQTAGFLRRLELSESELTKSIIGAIGELDAYLLPDARGYTSMIRHLMGITDAWRQEFRDQLLGARPQDFHQFADALETLAATGRVAALGSGEALKKASEEQPGWMEVRQVL